ncbi:MAG TPA: hypothetical protein VK426_11880 [Methanobacterium sp.]|nr:hypothetical protein [Methanobacterium sp.]
MKFKRLILGSFLIAVLILLFYNYALNEVYYTNSNLNELFYNYQDNQIFVSGIVTDTYPDGFEVSVYKEGNNSVYHVKTPFKSDLGSTIYVLGTLNFPNIIISTKFISVKESDFNFVIIRSVLGMILFLVIFLRYWKFDPRMMIIRRK